MVTKNAGLLRRLRLLARKVKRERSSLHLPGGGGIAIGIFAVFQLNIHGNKLITNKIGFSEVFGAARFDAGVD
jgi:hypothetical protein